MIAFIRMGGSFGFSRVLGTLYQEDAYVAVSNWIGMNARKLNLCTHAHWQCLEHRQTRLSSSVTCCCSSA